ncbi:WDFY3 protein, partial [Polypterus senegalus]|nr:WDFY3 protein [Polypterus senegalus]
MNMVKRIMGRPRQEECSPQDNALGLMHLRRLFSELCHPPRHMTQKEQEEKLYMMLPVFNRVFGSAPPSTMTEKFSDLLQFTTQVSRLMVTEIRRRASNKSTEAASRAIVQFLEVNQSEEASRGWMLLTTINLLASSGQKTVDCMTTMSVPSTLVKCLYLFFDLPHVPDVPGASQTEVPLADRRALLQKVFVQILVKLCSFVSPAEELAQKDDLQLLFSAITSWCPPHNLPWRKSAGEVLMTISRHGLSVNVVKYIHGHTVRNIQAFSVLQNAFLKAKTSRLTQFILDAISNIYLADNANYFILESQHTLSQFAEKISKLAEAQTKYFELLEFVVFSLNYIPCKELFSVSVLLKSSTSYQCSITAMRTLLKFTRHDPIFRDVFREVGLMEVMVNLLHKYAALLKDPTQGPNEQGDSKNNCIMDDQKQLALLVMETLTVLLQGSNTNAAVFREFGGARCVHNIVKYPQCREQALMIIQQLVLSPSGDDDMGTLLGLMHSAPPTELQLKTDILRALLVVLRESHRTRTVFRKVGGFVYVTSLLVAMERSLCCPPKSGWEKVNQNQVFELLHMVFCTLTAAMRYEPANSHFFRTEIQYEKLADAVRLLGCFSDSKKISPATVFPSNSQPFQRMLEDDLITIDSVSPTLRHCSKLFIYLYKMATDSFDRHGYHVVSASVPNVPLKGVGELKVNSGIVPLSSDLVIIHPGAVLATLDLLASVSSDVQPEHALDLQLAVANILQSLVHSERNQQIMCEAGLHSRLLQRCSAALGDEEHPLHPPLQRMFERLASQALQPMVLREFLRLGNPLNCGAWDKKLLKQYRVHKPSSLSYEAEMRSSMTMSMEGFGPDSVFAVNEDNNHYRISRSLMRSPEGSTVPLTRVKCLVSMTTPHDIRLHGSSVTPAFVEFDTSFEGFGCLFLPSLAPHNALSNNTTTSGVSDGAVVSGIGTGERLFPPPSGLTYSTWFCIERFSTPPNNHPVRLLNIVRRATSSEQHYVCLAIVLSAKDRSLIVSTKEELLQNYVDDFSEESSFYEILPCCARFRCGDLISEGQWHHLVLVMSKGMLKNSTATLYMDGQLVSTIKLHYIHSTPGGSSSVNPPVVSTVYSYIGTPPAQRQLSTLVWRLGPTHFLEEVLPATSISTIFELGPNCVGNFQAVYLPCKDAKAESTSPSSVALVPEEKVSFGLSAHSVSSLTVAKIRKVYNKLDSKAIAKQLAVSSHENATPVKLLHNTAGHLNGPARTVGAAVIGYLGVRAFVPKPVATTLQYIGGAAAILGLVAMASDVEGLYAAVKALVCVVKSNPLASKEMERIKGYQLLAMLLKKKRSLLNSHILHLTFSLVGTVDSGHETSIIPNSTAFQDLLCDFEVWLHAPYELHLSLFEHFIELLTESRFGQFISSTLPTFAVCEKFVVMETNNEEKLDGSNEDDFGGLLSANLILLRNRLLDILLKLLFTSKEKTSVNIQACEELVKVLGFDWLLKFMEEHLHSSTVTAALRILVVLLSNQSILTKFKEGLCGGGWLEQTDSVLTNKIGTVLGFNVGRSAGGRSTVREINRDACHFPGFPVLQTFLPKHINVPELYFLLMALFLQQPVTELPENLQVSDLDDEVGSPAEEFKAFTGDTGMNRSQSEYCNVGAKTYLTNHPAKKYVFDFMRVLIMDNLCLTPATKQTPIIDLLLEASPERSTRTQQKEFQTCILDSVMEHLLAADVLLGEDASLPITSGGSYQILVNNVFYFTQRVVDKLWQGMFSKEAKLVVEFIIQLIGQSKRRSQGLSLDSVYHCLNRTILYQLSRPHKTVPQQVALLDSLRVLTVNRNLILGPGNHDQEFIGCLAHCFINLYVGSSVDGFGLEAEARMTTWHIMMPTEVESDVHSQDVSEGRQLLLKAVNRVWAEFIQNKKQAIEEIFKVPLPSNERGQVDITNARTHIEEASARIWQNYLAHEKKCISRGETIVPVSQSKLSRVSSGFGLSKLTGSRRNRKESGLNKNNLTAQETFQWMFTHIAVVRDLVAMQYKEYQERQQNALKYVIEEWAQIEYELLRERGLWGPPIGSHLDKFLLEMTEGPCRMRKKMVRNDLFYIHYPYMPESEQETNVLKPTRYRRAISYDSKDYYMRLLSGNPGMYQHSVGQSSEGETTQQEPEHGEDTIAKVKGFVKPPLKRSRSTADGADEDSQEQLQDQILEAGSIDEEEKTDNTILLRLLEEGEKIQHMYRCARVQGLDTSEGLLLFGKEHFYVIDGFTMTVAREIRDIDTLPQNLYEPIIPRGARQGQSQLKRTYSIFAYEDIKEVHKRRYLLQRGEISNFQYLMHLNTLAGRSYNDLMQYPVFPWILADYDSEEVDLNNPKTFRNLSKPMGAQTEDRLAQYKKRFKDWEDPNGETPAYHYGTHYSSAMIVASYLVRMEPFTQIFLRLQGGHFDLADRMFHSVREAWLSASKHNMADVKELIPEFFYLPEFLLNSNNFDLGFKQNGTKLGDVILPPWAKGDPREFIRVHREALECDYVSTHLHEWIDLIFGYKQQGPPAVEAVNVFHHLFYEGQVDIYNINDPLKETATIGFINNFGQIPKQLFKKPHPPKRVRSRSNGEVPGLPAQIGSVGYKIFFHHLDNLRPSLTPVKELKDPVGQIVCTDKGILAVEQNKVLIPPAWNKTFAWGYADLSCRQANYESDKAVTVYECLSEWGQILCAICPNPKLVITGGTSTAICVWEMGTSKERAKMLTLKQALLGHTDAITCLTASSAYHIIVSGSRDRTCIIWDLNKLSFVTQLRGHRAPVSALCINELTGDIVSCAGTYIHVWSINGSPVVSVNTFTGKNQQILCCCVSEMNEWDTQNVILTGHSDGVVRFWRMEFLQVPETPAPEPAEIPDMPDCCSEDKLEGRDAADDESSDSDGDEQSLNQEPKAQSTQSESGSAVHRPKGSVGRHGTSWSGDSGSDDSRRWSDNLSSDEKDGFVFIYYSDGQIRVPVQSHMQSVPPSTVHPPSQSQPLQPCPAETRPYNRLKPGYRWERQLVFRSKLTMHTAFERKDNSHPAEITAIAISKDHNKILVGDNRGRVFSWSVSDQPGRSAADHWVKDEGGDNCSGCSVRFSLTERRHHCRNCGQLFCQKCSRFQSEIKRLKISSPVRVCQNCYYNLQHERGSDESSRN